MTAGLPGPILEVEDLRVHFMTRRGTVEAVRGVSLAVEPGETLGIVGESGSGKSVTAQAAMGLVHVPGRIVGGDIRWRGQSLLGPRGERYAASIRGRKMAIIFQDPMTSLNPVFTVGTQICEVMTYHLKMTRRQAMGRAREIMDLVGINAPDRRLKQYPHEFSGGMRQRVMIAMALACEPELLIADEPTTALDVTIQAQILELIAGLQQKLGLSVILITHDLGVVAGLCHRVAVMYAGRIAEQGEAEALFDNPAHPYTQGLLRSTPRVDEVRDRLIAIDGSPPSMIGPPAGCAFQARCPSADAACDNDPALVEVGPGRLAACVRPFTNSWTYDRESAAPARRTAGAA
ncbi:MAG: ABC transporter ATP-binding protein [Alphaproteobacteria bacterium]